MPAPWAKYLQGVFLLGKGVLNMNKLLPIRWLSVLILGVFLLLSGKSWAAEFEPVSYTAYTSLFWLREAGVPEAAEYAKATGKQHLLFTGKIKNFYTLQPVNMLYHEMRYAALNQYIQQNGYKNVMDIACGFSSRGLYMARHGIRFVGAEFPAVAVYGNNYLKKCLKPDELKLASYEVADATDKEQMMAAADLMQGPVCITMDGLMMYLTHEQQDSVLQNIKAILQKHGGCYITTDFSARDFVMDASKVVYGEKHAREVYRESAKVYEDIADADFDEKFFASDEEATKFITAQGLKVQRIPLFSQPITLYSEKGLNKQQLQRLDNMKNEKIVWLITIE